MIVRRNCGSSECLQLRTTLILIARVVDSWARIVDKTKRVERWAKKTNTIKTPCETISHGCTEEQDFSNLTKLTRHYSRWRVETRIVDRVHWRGTHAAYEKKILIRSRKWNLDRDEKEKAITLLDLRTMAHQRICHKIIPLFRIECKPDCTRRGQRIERVDARNFSIASWISLLKYFSMARHTVWIIYNGLFVGRENKWASSIGLSGPVSRKRSF